MYAPPGIGKQSPSASSLEAADERGRVVKALPYLSSLAQHTSPNEANSRARAASDPYCEGQVN